MGIFDDEEEERDGETNGGGVCADEKKNSCTTAKTERRKDATAPYKSWKRTVLVPPILNGKIWVRYKSTPEHLHK
jgi:hypothetical protein